MLDLRNYGSYIRELVAAENAKDENWKWSVKSIGKGLARIRWGYLDYLEEKENCFLLTLETDETGSWLHAQEPHGKMIDCYLVVEGEPDTRLGLETTLEGGIKSAIAQIAGYAHHHY